MGIYFRNSNAMSPVIRYTDGGKSVLSYISTGGNIEIYFMQRASAKEIISMYLNIVGKPNLPPFWALGWHASSPLYTT
jgi:alpha-glucosidase (family GH31 glycosyl hydrolase)